MAQEAIPGGSTFGLMRTALSRMFTELYAGGGQQTNIDVAGTLDVTGDTTLDAGLAVAGAVVMMTALPTGDPTVAGQLWNNSGVVTVSTGS